MGLYVIIYRMTQIKQTSWHNRKCHHIENILIHRRQLSPKGSFESLKAFTWNKINNVAFKHRKHSYLRTQEKMKKSKVMNNNFVRIDFIIYHTLSTNVDECRAYIKATFITTLNSLYNNYQFKWPTAKLPLWRRHIINLLRQPYV